MSLQLQPQKSFTVVRQIANHLDVSTYYVRAVIRNAYTDALIKTLDLTDRGEQRFSKNWQVPPDPSGEGFYISIVTSVYTDSGYTTKSENYGDEENTYLVRNHELLGRGGGGVDAYTVRRILKEELAKLPAPEKVEIPEAREPEMRWDETLAAIRAVGAKIDAQEAVDLSPVVSAVNRVFQAIQDKAVTPETDLTPVVSALKELQQTTFSENRQLALLIQTLEDTLAGKVVGAIHTDVVKTLEQAMKETTFTIAPTTATMDAPKPRQEEQQSSQGVPFDPSKLAL